MSDSETALGDRVESTLPTILSASSRGQLPTRMGGGKLSEKGEQREQVDVTSDETAMEKWGVMTLSRQRLSPRVSYPMVPASKSHQVGMC